MPNRKVRYEPFLLLISREELYHFYWDEKLSRAEVAARLNIQQDIIKWLMKKYMIPTRTRSESIRLRHEKDDYKLIHELAEKHRIPPQPREALQEMYTIRRMSSRQIALELGISPQIVLKWLHKYGIPVRPRQEGFHHNYNGLNREVCRRQEPILKARFKKVLSLSVESVIDYAPDFVVIEDDGRICAYEVEGGNASRSVVESKIERAKKAGFDGLYILRYLQKKNRETFLNFRGEEKLSIAQDT